MQCLRINVSKDIDMSIYHKEKIHESKENHSQMFAVVFEKLDSGLNAFG